jgi:hypothetical protein
VWGRVGKRVREAQIEGEYGDWCGRWGRVAFGFRRGERRRTRFMAATRLRPPPMQAPPGRRLSSVLSTHRIICMGWMRAAAQSRCHALVNAHENTCLDRGTCSCDPSCTDGPAVQRPSRHSYSDTPSPPYRRVEVYCSILDARTDITSDSFLDP